jgi:hypothetical protein
MQRLHLPLVEWILAAFLAQLLDQGLRLTRE